MFKNENLDDQLSLKGEVLVEVFDKDGVLKESRQIKNLVVTAGKNHIASRMAGTSSGVMSHMGIGSNNTAAANGDTALGAELGRVALSSIAAAAAVVTHAATFPAGTGTGAVTEAGIFNASSAGTMQCRTVFPVVNKGVDDAMAITWTVTVS
jgi:hypothetical protein